VIKERKKERFRAFESARASAEKVSGDCAHARDVALARASMTSVVRALFV